MPSRLRLPSILAAVLVLVGCSGSTSVTFELSRDMIQAKLDEKFPLQPGKEEVEGPPLQLTLADPVVLLEEGKSQIGVRVSVLAEVADIGARPPLPRPRDLPNLRFTGSATCFCSVSYDPKLRAIRLSEPKLTELKIERIPDRLSPVLSRIAEKALAQKFAEQPIPLKNETTLEQALTTYLKSVMVRDGKVLVEIGW